MVFLVLRTDRKCVCVCVCVVDVDRNKVFQTTRVRTALKNDVSWIQKSKQDKKEEDKAKYCVNLKQ